MADTTTRKPGNPAGIPASNTYTPGPWAWHGYSLRPVNADPANSAVHTVLTVEDAGSGFVDSDPAATHLELLADHRLIAAAPAMFEALTGARTALAQALGTVDAALSAIGAQGGAL